jgi:hypothetical protein
MTIAPVVQLLPGHWPNDTVLAKPKAALEFDHRIVGLVTKGTILIQVKTLDGIRELALQFLNRSASGTIAQFRLTSAVELSAQASRSGSRGVSSSAHASGQNDPGDGDYSREGLAHGGSFLG